MSDAPSVDALPDDLPLDYLNRAFSPHGEHSTYCHCPVAGGLNGQFCQYCGALIRYREEGSGRWPRISDGGAKQ